MLADGARSGHDRAMDAVATCAAAGRPFGLDRRGAVGVDGRGASPNDPFTRTGGVRRRPGRMAPPFPPCAGKFRERETARPGPWPERRGRHRIRIPPVRFERVVATARAGRSDADGRGQPDEDRARARDAAGQ